MEGFYCKGGKRARLARKGREQGFLFLASMSRGGKRVDVPGPGPWPQWEMDYPLKQPTSSR